jgi:hypothetical protein
MVFSTLENNQMTNEQLTRLVRVYELMDCGQIWKAKILLEEILEIKTKEIA